MLKVENNLRKILVVDDDKDSLRLMVAALRFAGYDVREANSGELALAKIAEQTPHMVFLDINMPGLNGLDTLKQLKSKEQYVSVMFVSARANTADVVTGLDLGADDYVRKPFSPEELLARVRTQLRIKDLNDQLRKANERLLELVDTDDLTGLFNMRSLYNRLNLEISRARRYGRIIGVVMMDMDHFKNINDNHDHLFGSFVLAETGKLIRQNIRQVDFAARYGGDEFLMVLTETSEAGIWRFADRIRKTVEEHVYQNGKDSASITASLGVAVTPSFAHTIDAKELVRAADHALFSAKEAGRNCVRSFTFKKTSSSIL
mgnify:CR=1 FL=1